MLRLITIIISLVVLSGCPKPPPKPPPTPTVIEPNINMREISKRPDPVSKEMLYKHFGREWVNSPYFTSKDVDVWGATRIKARCFSGRQVPVPIYEIKVSVKDNKCIYLDAPRDDQRYICAERIHKCARDRVERDQIIEALIGLGARY